MNNILINIKKNKNKNKSNFIKLVFINIITIKFQKC